MKGFGRVAGCLLVLCATLSVQLSCHAQAARPRNEVPMYGDPDKPNKLSARDRDYIASIEKAGHTRQEVALEVMGQGWGYYQKGDLASAIRKFNQAWLLDPENPNIYHGFALVVAQRDKAVGQAEQLFRMALSRPGVNVNAYVDFGRFLMVLDRLDESLVQFRKAIEVSPTAPNARSNLSIVYAKKGDYAQACEWAKAARDNHDLLAFGWLESTCGRAGVRQ